MDQVVTTGVGPTTTSPALACGAGHRRRARRARRLRLVVIVIGLIVASTHASVHAASTAITVTFQVASNTSVDMTACQGGVPGVTAFGSMPAGTPAVTAGTCDVEFGSSNDTAQLRLSQSDGLGNAMFQPTRGSVDPGFDTDGVATLNVSPTNGADAAHAVAIQADGRIVVAGVCDMGATGNDMCVSRFDDDGLPDGGFDLDGTVTLNVSPTNGADSAQAVAMQPDGRIVVAGTCAMGATGDDLCVARFDDDGSLDGGFDIDGIATLNVSPSNGADAAFGVAIQPDGRIVVAGTCDMGASGHDYCVARFEEDGSIDGGFDGDGVATASVSSVVGGYDEATSVALDDTGRIIVGGYCDMGATGADFCLVRFHAGGGLDSSFDTDGKVSTNLSAINSNDQAYSVVVTPDDDIVAAGFCQMGATGSDVCLARYSINGGLDLGFDGDGLVTTNVSSVSGFDHANDVIIQDDGKLLTSGECNMGATNADACLVRYTSGGALDPTFDDDGIMTADVSPTSGSDYFYSIASRPDGKVVSAGSCPMAVTGLDVCLLSLDDGGVLAQYQPGTSDWSTVDTSHFAACITSTTGGTSTWIEHATCGAGNGPHWNAIAAAPQAVATTALGATATTRFRFGVRTEPGQPTGVYVAPITFDVVAP